MFFMMGIGRNKDKFILYFSLLSLVLGLYILLILISSHSNDLQKQNFILIFQGVVICFFFFLFHKFLSVITGKRNLVIEIIVISSYLFLLIYSFVSGCGYWFSEITSIETYHYAWGETIYTVSGKTAWTYYISIFVQQLLYVYYLVQLIVLFVKKRDYMLLFIILNVLILNVVAFYDKGIDFQFWEGVYFGHYILILFLVFMGMYLLFIERKRVQHLIDLNGQLNYRETLFESVLLNIEDAVVMLNDSSRIILTNQGLEKLLQQTSQNLNGKLFDQFGYLTSRLDGSFVDLNQLANSGNPVLDCLLTAGEKSYQIIISGAVIEDDSLHKKYLFILRDKSTESNLKQKLLQSQKMEALGKLAGGIAHDFNNMLGGINGFTELLLDELDNESENFYFAQSIYDLSIRASSLTQKLLAFSRRSESVKKTIEVNKLLGDLENLLVRTVDKKIRIESLLHKGNLFCYGDDGEIFNAILNLAINSCDAMPDGGVLAISSAHEEISNSSYSIITISDTGSGIDEKIVDSIFEPFVTSKPEGKGTGLGLAAVKSVVEEHRGFIDFSTSKSGTSFQLHFPRFLPQDILEDQLETVQQGNDHCKGRTILIIDDERSILNMIRMQLKKLECHTLSASDGKTALSILQDEHKQIDLVILDMILPDISGLEILNFLKNEDNAIPVICTSGYDKSNFKITYPYPYRFLKKPFILKQLKKELQLLLNK